jgi:dTDP-4-dehydrorhamnose 3,5-epimerase-like enzyme
MARLKLINLPKILDKRGNLSFFEEETHVPFKIKRVYWIYDVPGGQIRGGHAFKKQKELIIALSGSFDVVVHDGKSEKTFSLNRSYYGLYVPSMLWRKMQNFSTNSLALVASSTYFNADDYIYDFDKYLILRRRNEKR